MLFQWWRFRVALIIWRTCHWKFRTAWQYADVMRDPYFNDPDGPTPPAEAIHEDQQYWDS